MDQKVQQHIEEALNEVRALFVKAATRIETLAPGEKVPATTLAEDLARAIIQPDGKPMTGPQIYPTLKFLFKGYPGVEIARGAHGGIKRLPVVTAPLAQPAADADDGK
jgi:hypothetical protein